MLNLIPEAFVVLYISVLRIDIYFGIMAKRLKEKLLSNITYIFIGIIAAITEGKIHSIKMNTFPSYFTQQSAYVLSKIPVMQVWKALHLCWKLYVLYCGFYNFEYKETSLDILNVIQREFS